MNSSALVPSGSFNTHQNKHYIVWIGNCISNYFTYLVCIGKTANGNYLLKLISKITPSRFYIFKVFQSRIQFSYCGGMIHIQVHYMYWMLGRLRGELCYIMGIVNEASWSVVHGDRLSNEHH